MGTKPGHLRASDEYRYDGTSGHPALSAVSEGLSWTARACLLAVLIIAPWVFGGVKYEHQAWLFGGSLVALGLWLVGFLLQPRELRIVEVIVPTLLVPLAAALLLGAIQLTRGLPQKFPRIEYYQTAAPTVDGTAPTLGRLAPPLGQQLAGRPQFSIFPASTRLEMARLTAGIAAFLAGLGLFAIPRMQRWLLGTLALNGACLAFFGIAQKLSWNGKIYWSVPLTLGGQPFASFVNRNNAAGYLNLCLAAAAGYLAWTVWNPARTTHHDESRSGYPSDRPRGRSLQTESLWAILLCALIMAGVGASLSRGGVLSGALAGLAVVLLVAARKGVRVAAWSAGIALLLCVCLLGWLGLTGGLFDRFDEKVSSSARWDNWKDAWRAARDFPILGTGFGTYRYAYQPYQVKPVKLWFYNADNHYVEGLTEGGAVGLALIACCVLLMFATLWLLIRRRSAGTEALAYVALFALVSQVVHTGFDFGISMPSNLLTFATLCGVFVGEAARRSVPHLPPWTIALPVWQPSLVVGTISVILIVTGWMGIEDVARAAVAREARHGLPPLTTPDSLHESRVDSRIEQLSEAVRQRPGDAEAQHLLGELYIYRYRLRAFEDWKQRHTADPRTEPIPRWAATGLAVLHRYANAAFRDAQYQTIDDLKEQPLVRENLHPARKHLLAAQAACTLITKTDLDLATLAFLEEDNPSGLFHLQRAVALAPVDEDELFTAGILAEQAARNDLCENYWRRSLSLGTRHQTQILDLILDKHPLDEVVDRLLPVSPTALLDLARTRFSAESRAAERKLLVQKAKTLMEATPGQFTESERLYWSGVAERLDGNLERASSLLQQAVSRESEMVDWRLELVAAYRAAGRLDEALDEVRSCLMIAPQRVSLEALRRDLVHEKLTTPSPPRATRNGTSTGTTGSPAGDSASKTNSEGAPP